MPEAFRRFAKGKPEWADVLALLPAPKPKAISEPRQDSTSLALPNNVRFAPRTDRSVRGNPTNFHALRHEPVNKQGVVLLFGMLAKELGFLVEAVQKGFPDCEAKRQIGPERWQRVSIEFEFEEFPQPPPSFAWLRHHCLLVPQLGRLPKAHRGRGALQRS